MLSMIDNIQLVNYMIIDIVYNFQVYKWPIFFKGIGKLNFAI